MISITVDEGYAFDYLAILSVKTLRGIYEPDVFLNCVKVLKEQIEDDELFDKILESQEYAECVRINGDVFDAVYKAKLDQIKASVVDNLNYERYLAKIKLQNRFFPKSKIVEKKN